MDYGSAAGSSYSRGLGNQPGQQVQQDLPQVGYAPEEEQILGVQREPPWQAMPDPTHLEGQQYYQPSVMSAASMPEYATGSFMSAAPQTATSTVLPGSYHVQNGYQAFHAPMQASTIWPPQSLPTTAQAPYQYNAPAFYPSGTDSRVQRQPSGAPVYPQQPSWASSLEYSRAAPQHTAWSIFPDGSAESLSSPKLGTVDRNPAAPPLQPLQYQGPVSGRSSWDEGNLQPDSHEQYANIIATGQGVGVPTSSRPSESQNMSLSRPLNSSAGISETSSKSTTPATQSRSRSLPARRRIAQSACEGCRRKRTKCVTESGNISCNVCSSLSIPCIFSGVDKRKESVRVLRSRLSQLEGLVGRLQAGDEAEMQDILRKLRSDTDIESSAWLKSPSSEPSLVNESGHTVHDGTFKRTAPMQEYTKSGQSLGAHSSNAEQSPAVALPYRTLPSATEDTLSELTDRLTVDEHGMIRAESAASSLAVEGSFTLQAVEPSTEAHASPDSPKSPTPPRIIIGPNVELPENTSLETVEHLLSLYFVWELPLHPVISQYTFLKQMATGQGPYFSSLLLNALLAFACTISDRSDVRANEYDFDFSGEQFFTMADDMLAEEIDGAIGPIRVPITTVQALLVMVSWLLAIGNDLKAWMLLDTCSRMLLELGLHLDAQRFLRGNPQSKVHVFSRDDLYIRAKTFWSVWIFEQEMCTMFGRTGVLRDIVITCPLLEHFDTDCSRLEHLSWKYAVEAHNRGNPVFRTDDKGDFWSLWPRARDIVTVFAYSTRIIYSQVARTSAKGADVQAALNHVMQQARDLVKGLPTIPTLDELSQTSDQAPAPHMLMYIHLLVHSHIILVNRPFLTGSAHADYTRSSASPPNDTEIAAAEDSPRVRCIKSALKIVEIVQLRRDLYKDDLRTAAISIAYILMSAATIFLSEFSSILDKKNQRFSDVSPAPEEGKTGDSSLLPPEHDYQARHTFGQRHLHDKIYPFLENMGRIRPAPLQLLERLKKVVAERDAMVREYGKRPQV